MTSPKYGPGDDWLSQELNAATIELVAVPAADRDTARAPFPWRNVDDELTLVLCFDSAVDDVALVRGLASMTTRSMSFQNDNLGVEIDIYGGQVTGQLLPPQPGSVRLVTPKGVFAQTATDATGCFVVACPAHGPLRLECSVADLVLATEWAPF
jgi:hypothetical protein